MKDKEVQGPIVGYGNFQIAVIMAFSGGGNWAEKFRPTFLFLYHNTVDDLLAEFFSDNLFFGGSLSILLMNYWLIPGGTLTTFII